MPRLFFVALFLLLIGCSAPPSPRPIQAGPTSTVDPPLLISPTATAPPLPPTALPPALSVECNWQHAPCQIPFRAWLQRPIAPPGSDRIDLSYLFGTTQEGQRVPHHGLEFPNPTGTPVLAAAAGRVVVAGNDHKTAYGPGKDVYGNLVVLEHHLPLLDKPVYTLYAHLSSVEVSPGQEIKAGEILGKVGKSGAAVGSHLHFEVRLGENAYGQARNPILWLAPRQDEAGRPLGALAGRVVDASGRPLHLILQVQFYRSRNEPPQRAFEIETYAPEKYPVQGDDILQENFVLPDLPPGWYRLTTLKGAWQEVWAEVASNRLTLVSIMLK